jgi:hypothetical protein
MTLSSRSFNPSAPRFRDVPQLTNYGSYAVDHSWRHLEEATAHYAESYRFDFGESDFQRAHVWTEAQQIAFVEFGLKGGRSGMSILTNVEDFSSGTGEQMVLVDGKQRLNAVLSFLRNEIPAFGVFYREFGDKLNMTGPSFRWHVNDLTGKKAVLNWYLELNAGGTVHTDAELDKVRDLLNGG